jgi:hypothetical protein
MRDEFHFYYWRGAAKSDLFWIPIYCAAEYMNKCRLISGLFIRVTMECLSWVLLKVLIHRLTRAFQTAELSILRQSQSKEVFLKSNIIDLEIQVFSLLSLHSCKEEKVCAKFSEDMKEKG